jgi:hypothetical protein
MPGKRQKTRHDFNLLSTDDATQTEDKDDNGSESGVARVMGVADAPTNSRFYTDAQT